MTAPEQTPYPPLLRFLLWIGRPFGLAFVPEHHVQVIYRMGQYAGAHGPGLIRHNRLTETLGPLVATGGQMKQFEFSGLISNDTLPVGMRLGATLSYDPRRAPELASVLTRLPREAYQSIARPFVQWAALAAVNRYAASELARNEVRARIEQEVSERLEAEMGFLGLSLRRLRVLGVTPPPALAERHALIAQRRASILAGAEFHPAEYRRALVTEVIENLGRRGGAESFVNFSDMLEAYAAERPEQLPRIVQGTAPPAGRDTASADPPRPRSRL